MPVQKFEKLDRHLAADHSPAFRLEPIPESRRRKPAALFTFERDGSVHPLGDDRPQEEVIMRDLIDHARTTAAPHEGADRRFFF